MNTTLLAACLHSLFTCRAEELADAAHFSQRRSKLTGPAFLRALATVWSQHPHASSEQLALPLGISRQALFNRFTPQATTLCRSALLAALDHFFQAQPQTMPLLDRFAGVFLDDCTQLPLPDACAAEFAGCGSGVCELGKAGMKVFTRFEIQRGHIPHLSIHPARYADAKALAAAPALPKGCLHLADLGFADFAQFQSQTDQGIYRITRLPVQTLVRLLDQDAPVPLAELLRRWRLQGETTVDRLHVQIGDKERATGRLTLLACPAEVAEKRLRQAQAQAQRRGRTVSARQQEMCHWQVLFSNVPPTWLSANQVWQVYRLRWQIELLFKRFKSHGGMQQSHSVQPERVKCEWYVKLLLQVLQNWLRLLRGGPLAGINQVLLGRVVAGGCGKLLEVLTQGVVALQQVLEQLQQQLGRLRARTKRRRKPTASQWFSETARAG